MRRGVVLRGRRRIGGPAAIAERPRHAVAWTGRGLVRFAAASQRARRYEHRFDAAYGTTVRQRAVLCVMLLRGPQTPAELLARAERLADFHSLDEVRDTLERLLQREPPLVAALPLAHGQREIRYMHLLGGPLDLEALAAAEPAPAAPRNTDLVERVERLEAEVAALREELAALREQADRG